MSDHVAIFTGKILKINGSKYRPLYRYLPLTKYKVLLTFGRRRVVTNVTPVRLVATLVLLAPAQTRMLTILHTVLTHLVGPGRVRLVLLAHVNVQSLAVLVVPVAFGTLELLARIPRMHGRFDRDRCLVWSRRFSLLVQLLPF